ncbi:MAG: hypothetical protein WC048_15330 [Rhizobium sp.]
MPQQQKFVSSFESLSPNLMGRRRFVFIAQKLPCTSPRSRCDAAPALIVDIRGRHLFLGDHTAVSARPIERFNMEFLWHRNISARRWGFARREK